MKFEELAAKYPEFLADTWCGAYCGDGWVPILDRMFADFKEIGGKIIVAQIKEKWGGLRVYVEVEASNFDAVSDRIVEAENESFKTCEDCGDPGKRRSGGWIRTLCDSCEQIKHKRSRSREMAEPKLHVEGKEKEVYTDGKLKAWSGNIVTITLLSDDCDVSASVSSTTNVPAPTLSEVCHGGFYVVSFVAPDIREGATGGELTITITESNGTTHDVTVSVYSGF